jgi:hypothetical protein
MAEKKLDWLGRPISANPIARKAKTAMPRPANVLRKGMRKK